MESVEGRVGLVVEDVVLSIGGGPEDCVEKIVERIGLSRVVVFLVLSPVVLEDSYDVNIPAIVDLSACSIPGQPKYRNDA